MSMRKVTATHSRIRELANLYEAHTGHHVYSGHSGGTYYFTGPVSGYVRGYDAALMHMRQACRDAGMEIS